MTDFYQFTMAQGFWLSGIDQREAVYHLNFRRPPFNGGITIAAGLESVIKLLEQFQFQSEDIAYLKSLKDPKGKPLFHENFLIYLKEMKFTCDIDAVEEGEIMFPYEPLLRVQGPLIQCQLLESLLLNVINFQTIIATKAARLFIASGGAPILELGFRRAQGLDGALSASRAAYIGGCSATSNVLAGKEFGIPVRGTMAHSWVMAFDDEATAFEEFAKNMPSQTVFLVDTYQTLEGVKHAIEIGNKIKLLGHQFLGIRLDSGDLAYLSIEARKMLDQAGFKETKIYATNELDELIIRDLIQQGAKINVWGVGTNLVTSQGQSALDGVYKMSALKDERGDWMYKMKCSEQMMKISNPGILQVRRFLNKQQYIGDAIYDLNESCGSNWVIVDPLDPTKRKSFNCPENYKDLLIPIFREGKKVYTEPSLDQIKQKVSQELSCFHKGLKRFLFPHQYPHGLEEKLYNRKIQLVEKIRGHREESASHHRSAK
ncbi:MAG: Nicotinate phosphoribosyltransferase pncB2 [Chlamydiae bacterium]|nr:Nicotinate phosphoribosyltransferase pncB2 [Chlamydiota bacterium]